MEGSYYYLTSDEWLADALTYAYNTREADVVAISWWFYSILDELVSDVIENASIIARNGKGLPIITGSGELYSLISYEDSQSTTSNDVSDLILSIGATGSCGQRVSVGYVCNIYASWESNYNSFEPEVDLMAPGYRISTTEISLSQYYTTYAQYTGIAAAHVAGVAALMLSVNNNLTSQQVYSIIESTCKKIRPDLYTYTNLPTYPNGKWNEEMGYGLINANLAVMKAYFYNDSIKGNHTILHCNTSLYTFSKVVPSWGDIIWTTSDNLTIISGQNADSLYVTAIGPGNGWILWG